MVNRKIVQQALKQAWKSVDSLGFTRGNQTDSRSGIVSQLIYDIFGGEILKTHEKKGWHFYNRIEGERIDFTISEMSKFSIYNNAEDILSTPEEVHNYFEQENYLTFYMRFINAFEEIVGLKKYRRSA